MVSISGRTDCPGGHPHPIVFCDFDGTITQLDVIDQIVSRFAHPSWRQIEQEWVRGSIGSRECLEREMALVRASRKELDALIDTIPVDPHFASFCTRAEALGVPVYVVSDGFDYIVRRILRRSGLTAFFRNGSRLFAGGLRFRAQRMVVSFPHASPLCEHGCATCKVAVMRELRRGHWPAVFIGNGLSDRFAVREAHKVFAKGQLLEHCRAKGIDCEPFETFADIENKMSRIAGRRLNC